MNKLISSLVAIFAIQFATTSYCFAENPSPTEIESKVKKAVALIEKDGPAAFATIGDTNGEFVWKGTYLWVHGLDGMMHMHPFKPAMNGNSISSVIDENGKKLFLEMNVIVETKTSGWMDYMWPKPNSEIAVRKVSYVHGATHNGTTYVVGCGIYDVPDSEIDALLEK